MIATYKIYTLHTFTKRKGEDGQQQPLPPLKTIHIDAGIKNAIFDCAGRGVEGRDAKGSLNLSIYDNGSRPTHIWARDLSGEDVTLRQFISYGDNSGLTNPEDENLKGQPYQYYDEAGLTTFTHYDFKGNLLHKQRQVISDAETGSNDTYW